MRVLGVIPARLDSTRLPNKPLQMLAGEPMITRVVQRVQEHGLVDELVVATDSPMVVQVAERSGARAVLTVRGHPTGTDRVAEVAAREEFGGFDAIVNVQGDEPFLTREALAGAIERVAQGDDIGTAAAPLDPALADDPARVKVVTDARSRALYFSRAAIPHLREAGDGGPGLYWQHVGLYAFTRESLRRWTSLEPSPAELAERLEQLRALHHGLRIGVALLAEPVEPGVDTPDDLRRAEAHWHALQR
ncbi:MAG TPA: 3-deoxy-manno-octulosonate cytidylyltransferase [Gemmatimonadales bacterium]|nr:3-deoxy-manno-octulosonate cytidylyltransferase [Gemmatimonadales bacterium]